VSDSQGVNGCGANPRTQELGHFHLVLRVEPVLFCGFQEVQAFDHERPDRPQRNWFELKLSAADLEECDVPVTDRA
jgi:hypothetical protein